MSKDSSSGELNEPKINRNLLKLASDMPRVGDGGGLEEAISIQHTTDDWFVLLN
jgi:hypothetical protein